MISVIVPVYNTEKFLEECVSSICAQTFKDLEIILVDDGSTDKSPAICDQLAEKDSRIRVIHKQNGGVSSARNMGLDMAVGEYIAFADSDDLLTPELFSTLYSCLKEEKVDRVCGGFAHFYEDGHRVYRKSRIKDGRYATDEILSKMIDDGSMSGFLFSGVYNSLFINEIIKRNHLRFNQEIKYNEDGLFSFEYALHSDAMYSLRSQPLYLYRQHSDSSTGKRKKGDKYSGLHEYLAKLNFDRERYGFDVQMKRRNVTIALWEILDICKTEKGKEARNSIKEVINSVRLKESYDYIDPKNLNKYKKTYFYLMKYGQTELLYQLTKHILPFLSKHISR